MMKKLLLCVLAFSVGAGSAYMYFKNNGAALCVGRGRGNNLRHGGFSRGSLESLKVRGVRSLTRLETRISDQISSNSNQAAKLQPLCLGVGALRDKFSALDTAESVESALAAENNFQQRSEPRFPAGSIEALHARGVRILTMLELMIARRIDMRADQSEEMLQSLKKDVLVLKQKFENLVAK